MTILKVIDAHLHFSNKEGFKETATKIGHLEYSAKGLKEAFEQSGVVAGVVMTTPRREELSSQDELILEDGSLDCLLSCVGVNPEKLKEDDQELLYIEEELKKCTVTGIKIYPGYFPYYVYDEVYEPIYVLAKKYNVPVVIHCGDTQSPHGLLKYAHPLTIDELAVKYQEITFVICHMGVPWVMDTAELIAKNPNVYTDLSGLIAGSSEEVKRMSNTRLYVELIQQALVYANRYDKVLFGTDWPLVPIEPYIDFIKRVVPEAYYEDVFYNNALSVFPKIKDLI